MMHFYGQARLIKDPEIKETASGLTVMNITVSSYAGKVNGEYKNFLMNLTAFGKAAQVLAGNLKKGSTFYPSGELDYQTWEDKEGNKRNKLSGIIRQFDFGPKSESTSSDLDLEMPF